MQCKEVNRYRTGGSRQEVQEVHRVLGGPHTDRAVGMWYKCCVWHAGHDAGSEWSGSVRCDKWRTRLNQIGRPVGPGHPGSLPRKERKSKEGARQAGLAIRFGLN